MTQNNNQLYNSERPVDALAVKKVTDWLTHNLKSRDASASKKDLRLVKQIIHDSIPL